MTDTPQAPEPWPIARLGSLTCEYCRNTPAACLLVIDFEYSRVKALVCEPCGRRAQPDAAGVAKAAWLFMLARADHEAAVTAAGKED